MVKVVQSRQSRTAINLPGPHELSDIAQTLGLKGAVSRAFQEHVGRIARDLVAAIEANQASPTARRAKRVRALESISRSLKRVLQSLEGPTETFAIQKLLAVDLGVLLSTAAFERALRINLAEEVSLHALESHEAESSAGLIAGLEAEMVEIRLRLAYRHGDKVLLAVLTQIQSRLELALGLEKSHRGGSPGNYLRHYVVRSLVPLHRDLVREHGWSDTKSTFLDLCNQVLGVLGLSTDGLEKAVDRVLKRRSKTSRSP